MTKNTSEMEDNEFKEAIVRAVFCMDVDELKRLTADRRIPDSLFSDMDFLNDDPDFQYHTYPIHYIPALWEICVGGGKVVGL